MEINRQNFLKSDLISDVEWSEEYLKWLKDEDWDYHRINMLSDKFIEFMRLNRIYTYENIVNISKEFDSVYGNCDNLPFNDYDQVTAYCLIHFLTRYRRFQLIFQEMIRNKVFPKTDNGYPIYILDIGTGPGPSLFALSDFFLSLKQFGESHHIQDLASIDFQLDYVEKSNGFRDWLHHFTEYANGNCNSIEKDLIWRTPYHHGTFSDLKNINFNKEYYYDEMDDDGDYNTMKGVIKYRPHIVIASNFFTTREMAQNFKIDLKKCIKYMKNKSVLIVTGGKNEKYKEINQLIDKFVSHKNKKSGRFLSTCVRHDKIDSELSYEYSDKSAYSIKYAKRNILGLFDSGLLKQNVSKKTLRKIRGSIGERSTGKDTWGLMVFQKFSKLIK